MINPLLEHVPIKLEASEEDGEDDGDDDNNANDKHKRNVNGKTRRLLNAGADGDGDMEADDDDEDDDDDEESEEESETDLLEDEDETMLAISSDEEAELEAQRIKLQDLIASSLLQSGGVVGVKQMRGRSASSCTSVSTNCSSVVMVEQRTTKRQQQQPKRKQKQQKEHQSTSTQKQQKQRSKQQPKSAATSASGQTKNGVASGTTAAVEKAASSPARRGRKRSSSTCSVASSLVTPSCQTESCGNIYQVDEAQIYLFNCSFCEELCEDMTIFSRHMQVAHKLFDEELDEASLAKAAETGGAARRSARKQTKQGGAQAQTLSTSVKQEPRTPTTDQESPSSKLAGLGYKGPMQSCGNIFVLNRKKLFLICGYCECKYANLELFDRHVRQQHKIFGSPCKEIDVMPRVEMKKEVFIITEIEATPIGNASVVEVVRTPKGPVTTTVAPPPVPAQAMVAIPDGMNLNNNDLLSSPTPETPPPEVERTERVRAVDTVLTKDTNAIEVEKHLLVEESRKSSDDEDEAQDAEEKCDTEEITKSAKKEQQKRVTKRKRKRKTFSRCRSPPKRRAAKPAKFVSEEPIASSPSPTPAPSRRRGHRASRQSNKIAIVIDKSDSEDTDSSAFSPQSEKSSKTSRLPDDGIAVANEVDSCSGSLADSEFVAFGSHVAPPQLHHCDLCQKAFKKSSRLAEHRRLHTGEKPFRCEECGREFRIKMRLNEHKLRHRKEKAFKCEECGLCVSTKQDLVLHQRHHSGDRRYRCPECPKAFVRGSDLKIHVRVHTGEKPFVCDICQKSFRANQNLIVHRRSHLGEKNYKCDFCDKRFMRNIDRKVHHRTHTGEKPFKCEICQRGYSSRVHVRAHIEREHVKAADGSKAERKKPGPRPKRFKEEMAKQQQMIEELQHQLLQQIMAEDMADDDGDLDIEAKVERKSTTQQPPTAPETELAETARKVENIESSSKHAATGMQQVSVTVSMQVQENIAEVIEPMPEKENDTTLASPATLNQSVKKERSKITSYFTVVGQKTEI